LVLLVVMLTVLPRVLACLCARALPQMPLHQLLQGRQKKGVPAATLAERGVASMHLQEGLLLLLNLLNAGGSLVLPCALVLSNKVGERTHVVNSSRQCLCNPAFCGTLLCS
jgi:hypothetical protein